MAVPAILSLIVFLVIGVTMGHIWIALLAWLAFIAFIVRCAKVTITRNERYHDDINEV